MKSLFVKISFLFFLISIGQSCQNEPIGSSLAVTTDLIKKDDVLFHLLQDIATTDSDPLKTIVCIDFIYPFQLLIYDETYQIINKKVITGDEMFSDFLANLPIDQFISISYPLQTRLADGTVFSVTNNAELKLAIDACSKPDIIGYCTDLFGDPQGSCVWEVPFIENEDNEFAGAVFSANIDGSITIYHLNETYTGTWIFLFIDDHLYLNINISGTSSVAGAWNLNYKILTFQEDFIEIKADDVRRTLIKKCKSSTTYEIGDIGPKGGIIGYKKNAYTNGWQYIEVAQTDLIQEEWGCLSSEVTKAQFSEIGCGLQNTNAVLNYHNNLANYYANPAICNSSNNGTLTSKSAKNIIINDSKDWFIPSKNELNQIYTNLSRLQIGNFENANYWSSTESNQANAWVLNMVSGVNSVTNKNSLQTKTRVIRYF